MYNQIAHCRMIRWSCIFDNFKYVSKEVITPIFGPYCLATATLLQQFIKSNLLAATNLNKSHNSITAYAPIVT